MTSDPGRGAAGPGGIEVAAMLAAAVVLHVVVLVYAFSYGDTLLHWVDNFWYVTIAGAIHHRAWICDPDCTWHLWGFPFAIAGLADVLRSSDLTALIAISAAAALATAFVTQRLYGGWVAAAAVAVPVMGIEVAARGGSEPLFMALIYGAFLAWRRGSTGLGALLAALSSTVRPVGPMVLAAFALDAALARDWRRLWILCGISAAVAIGYLAAVAAIAGNPVTTSIGYLDSGWGRVPVGWPLVGFARDLRTIADDSLFQVLKATALMALICVSLWRTFRSGHETPRAERYFAIAYAALLVCGTHRGMAAFLPRLALPVMPLVFESLREWLPRRRWVWWSVAMAIAVLGAMGTGRLYGRLGTG